MQDGIALMYIKEGTLYPVAMTAEQHQMLTMLVAGICKPLHVMTEFPQGKAVNLTGAK